MYVCTFSNYLFSFVVLYKSLETFPLLSGFFFSAFVSVLCIFVFFTKYKRQLFEQMFLIY